MVKTTQTRSGVPCTHKSKVIGKADGDYLLICFSVLLLFNFIFCPFNPAALHCSESKSAGKDENEKECLGKKR